MGEGGGSSYGGGWLGFRAWRRGRRHRDRERGGGDNREREIEEGAIALFLIN